MFMDRALISELRVENGIGAGIGSLGAVNRLAVKLEEEEKGDVSGSSLEPGDDDTPFRSSAY